MLAHGRDVRRYTRLLGDIATQEPGAATTVGERAGNAGVGRSCSGQGSTGPMINGTPARQAGGHPAAVPAERSSNELGPAADGVRVSEVADCSSCQISAGSLRPGAA